MLFYLFLILATLAPCLAQGGAPRTVCDFDDTKTVWRSKFTGHQVAVVERDGRQTQALRLTYDLKKEPGYDWVRAMVPEGLDVRPYRYLTLRVRGDGKGTILHPTLLQTVTGPEGGQHGEKGAPAGEYPIAVSFTGWKQLSIPLSGFEGLDAIAARVNMVNFSLGEGAGGPASGEIWLDDLRLAMAPEGELVAAGAVPPGPRIGIAGPDEFFAALDLERPELAEVRKAAEAKDWPAAIRAWARHLETRQQPRWLWSRRDRERITRLYAADGGLARAVPAADRVLARDFNWLGVRKKLEHHIVWLHGPIEWTHVLSRFGYWRDLGNAYWATGKSAYAADFVTILKDWVTDNPVPERPTNSRGANGSVWRTLETGIRGDGWWDSMEQFMDAPEFDAEAKYLMTRSLMEQARYLQRYERGFSHGNWQVVECTGLAAIGIMLPEAKEAPAWRERAFHYLVQHMREDVYPDGAHYEVTPGYHGWVMNQFLRTALLCKANGYEVPGLLDRHERMFDFLLQISKPDRRFPPLGDAGSGGSITDSMGLGALLYNRPEMRWLGAPQASPQWVWLFGPERLDTYAGLPARPPAFTSSMLPNSQYCMMRSGWEKEDRYLLFDCAPWGGGHSHQDRLNLICYAGRDLLVDPGIYSYDQPLSASYFRKGVAHSILLVDDAEQIQANPEVLKWQTSPEVDFASGRIAAGGLAHQRSVLFIRPDYWVVVDHVSGAGSHNLTRLFHFAKGEVRAGADSVRTLFPNGQNLRVLVPDGAALEMRKGWLATGGATAEEAPVAAWSTKATLPAALCAVLTPFRAEGELPEVRLLPDANPQVARLALTWADGRRDEIAVAPEPADLAIGERKAHARALVVRRGPGGEKVASVE